ncbi:unnamed protein product [Didymodactylos carnosus]|uniref:NAD(P)(+)--arginine ADP-ribosyltransferase n=1 Tax=Didymodactylos carnosus TaxID=1234261 RepID=A0A814XE17_9BILA|nr:unnamed protein product [Didymodactylos carnosus]CAF1213746.1 unnamed protein product [Didymodactylos carnosus]CAF3813367.1 unnamed protein product [Didymodactylos carnosus]CAF3977735.1 unnamed protein product [Didymodactylos carnosus]
MDPDPRLRYIDIGDEPMIQLEPIRGGENVPLMSLEMAVESLKPMIDVLPSVSISKKKCQHLHDNLTLDESAAIRLYTMQNLSQHLNGILRSKVRAELLHPWIPYLKLLLTALYKLPSVKKIVWRGTNLDLSTLYKPGDRCAWCGFSSCTESITVADFFLGKSGSRTLFCIECENGRLITQHSQFADENEILLLPDFYFQVIDMRVGDGFPIIHVKEIQPPPRLLELPFPSNESVKCNLNGCISIKQKHPTCVINGERCHNLCIVS